ncbi:MAG: LuxR C-terminal-related transcriptional regulator, partial [Bacteroidota bacterium]|nr:LuxR C-terminal-related transcriptional regulator [Bacteroidota bacterium]
VIKDNIDSDNDWQQFKLHFEEVHIGFFDNLKTNYPGLTQNELKLCAYLRINLSSKEIAQMLHNTSDTINKSRYRLRKKLNLSNEDDLIEFIRNV